MNRKDMKRELSALSSSYESALRRYLKQGSKAKLPPARKLGRRAVALKLDTLDLALMHEEALIEQIISVGSAAERKRIIKESKVFFTEAVVPLEETHRIAVQTAAELGRLNKSLSKRTEELDASNREMKNEIARRRVVEADLRESDRESARLLEHARHQEKELRLLSRRILSAQEEERKRISRELHDVVTQLLTGINFRLATLKSETDECSRHISKQIEKTQRLVEKSVNVVYRFARELRPAILDDLGLIPALHSFMKSFSKKHGIKIKLTAFESVEKLSGEKRMVLYRVAHEALTNVARHSTAGRVAVKIRRIPSAVQMDISDNGEGFDLQRVLPGGEARRLGLLGMRERIEMVGGKLTVESAPGSGTTIQVQIPFSDKKKKKKKNEENTCA